MLSDDLKHSNGPVEEPPFPPLRGRARVRALHRVPYAHKKRAAIAVATHDGAVRRLAGNATIELIGSLQVALAFGVEQVVGFRRRLPDRS